MLMVMLDRSTVRSGNEGNDGNLRGIRREFEKTRDYIDGEGLIYTSA
jgi:hypothetical protein